MGSPIHFGAITVKSGTSGRTKGWLNRIAIGPQCVNFTLSYRKESQRMGKNRRESQAIVDNRR